MRRSILACLTTLLVLVYASAPVAFAQDARTPADICASEVPALEPANRTFTAPEQVLQPGVDYRAIFCTDAGAVYVDLFENYTPITVNSFVFLAQNRYYNNTTFHRVLQDFMAQGGDPTGTGRGGPGYSFVNEPVGFLNFDSPGWLAMANAGADTNGSQFFITTVPYPSLNYNYTIFGEVLEGQENVDAIRLRDPDTATEPGTALNTVVIVTDPATVQTTYVAPALASREDVQTMLDALNGGLPESIQVDGEYSGIFDTAQTAQFAPGDLSSDFAAFLEAHHHEYRAADRVTNAQCDLNAAPFVSIGYTLDRFATPEDAAAALADSFLPQLESASGYTATDVEGLAYPLYTQTRTACDQQVTDALTYWQRGHFVATLQAVFPADHSIPPERWLTELVGVSTFERIFSDVLRREIR